MASRSLFCSILFCLTLYSCFDSNTSVKEAYNVPVVQLNILRVDEGTKVELDLFFDDLRYALYYMDTLYANGDLSSEIADKIKRLIEALQINHLDRIYNVNSADFIDQEITIWGENSAYSHMIKSFGNYDTPKEVFALINELEMWVSKLGGSGIIY